MNPTSSKKIRLAVDCRPLMDPRPSGVATYTKNMIWALAQRPELNLDLFYGARQEAPHLKALFPQVRFYKSSSWGSQLKARWGRPSAPSSFWVQKPDLIWVPDRRMPEPLSGVPVVMTIHDLIPEHRPQSQSLKARLWHKIFSLKKLLKRVDGLLVPTLTVYHDLEAKVPFLKKEITYEGAKNPGQNLKQKSAQFNPNPERINPVLKKLFRQDFFLTLGAADPRKRLDWVLRAAEQFPKTDFLILGADSSDPRFAKALPSMLPKNITVLPRVSDFEKKACYRHALSFLALSEEEGFDLPALEALHEKCPLILSDIPVHRELYASQKWIQTEPDLWASLDHALHTPRQKLQAENPQPKGDFTWAKAAERASLFFLRVLADKDRKCSGHRNC